MKVLHLISNRDNSGGTIAALNLHHALINIGYDSTVLSSDRLFGSLNGNGYRKFGGIIGRIQQAFLKLEDQLAKPGFINPMDKWILKKTLSKFDGIIHIHVTHVAQTSFDLLQWLSKDNSVFWTLHDLWPLTAKCIHPTYCNKWLEKCYDCPKLEEYPKLKWDNTPFLYEQKHKFIQANKIHFISPSQWINGMCKNKIDELGGRISTIPHGINSEIFKKKDSNLVRQELGLPNDGQFILFPQGRWDDPKKGGSWYLELKNALASQKTLPRKIYFLKIEGDSFQYNQLSPFFTEVLLPHAQTKEQMAKYYQSADVSISLSEIETFGLCVAESLSCGLPVIARKANGINELLENAPNILVDDVQELIQLILTEKWKEFDYNALFDDRYSLETWARRHIELYESSILK